MNRFWILLALIYIGGTAIDASRSRACHLERKQLLNSLMPEIASYLPEHPDSASLIAAELLRRNGITPDSDCIVIWPDSHSFQFSVIEKLPAGIGWLFGNSRLVFRVSSHGWLHAANTEPVDYLDPSVCPWALVHETGTMTRVARILGPPVLKVGHAVAVGTMEELPVLTKSGAKSGRRIALLRMNDRSETVINGFLSVMALSPELVLGRKDTADIFRTWTPAWNDYSEIRDGFRPLTIQ